MHRSRPLDNREFRISKFLAKTLRHANDRSILWEDGYASVDQLLGMREPRRLRATLSDVEKIAKLDEKNRFEKSYEQSRGHIIRCRQGHTVRFVEPKWLLNDVESVSDLTSCFHGTTVDCVPNILDSGLKAGSRAMVHFALPNEASGPRPEATVFFKLEASICADFGIKFFKSSNNVILSEGIQGLIPSYCITGPYFIKNEGEDRQQTKYRFVSTQRAINCHDPKLAEQEPYLLDDEEERKKIVHFMKGARANVLCVVDFVGSMYNNWLMAENSIQEAKLEVLILRLQTFSKAAKRIGCFVMSTDDAIRRKDGKIEWKFDAHGFAWV